VGSGQALLTNAANRDTAQDDEQPLTPVTRAATELQVAVGHAASRPTEKLQI
jgi:hypothetical protein